MHGELLGGDFTAELWIQYFRTARSTVELRHAIGPLVAPAVSCPGWQVGGTWPTPSSQSNMAAPISNTEWKRCITLLSSYCFLVLVKKLYWQSCAISTCVRDVFVLLCTNHHLVCRCCVRVRTSDANHNKGDVLLVFPTSKLEQLALHCHCGKSVSIAVLENKILLSLDLPPYMSVKTFLLSMDFFFPPRNWHVSIWHVFFFTTSRLTHLLRLMLVSFGILHFLKPEEWMCRCWRFRELEFRSRCGGCQRDICRQCCLSYQGRLSMSSQGQPSL